MSLPDLTSAFLKTKTGETRRLYERGILLFCENILKDIPPEQVTDSHYAAFCEWIADQDLKAISKHSYVKGPRRFLRYLTIKKYCNISTDVLLEFEREILPKIEEKKYRLPDGVIDFSIKYHTFPAPPRKSKDVYLSYLRERAFLGVLEATGTRIKAGCGILVKNIDWKRDPVRILIKGKGNREHYLRIQGRQARYLKQWLSERGEAADYVFPAMRGNGYMSTETGRKIIERWTRLILGDGYHFTAHAFRHLFITRARDKYGLEIAQTLADHKNIATTSRYPDARREEELDTIYKDLFRE